MCFSFTIAALRALGLRLLFNLVHVRYIGFIVKAGITQELNWRQINVNHTLLNADKLAYLER
jgi:hypothetical protein